MPQPFNYMLNLASPAETFLQGLQIADQQMQQEAKRRQAEQTQNVLKGLVSLGSNATAEDYAKASIALPEYREAFKQSWDMMDNAKRDGLFRGAFDAYMAANDPAAAKAKLDEWAAGYENSGDAQTAKMFRDAGKMVESNPTAAQTTIGMLLAFADGERFKNLAQPKENTTFQKDFQFIKDMFGVDAAAEFAQYGRDSVVSIPLGNGQTYVGPASMAPGSSNWRARGEGGPSGIPSPTPPSSAEPGSVFSLMADAEKRGAISQAEFDVIKGSFGETGQAALKTWLKRYNVKLIARTGTDAQGRRVVQYTDGTVDYAD